MTDRELLELAAKAAGIVLGWDAEGAYQVLPGVSGSDVRWSPLDDDGEALWLAVQLDFSVHIGAGKVKVMYPDWRDSLIGKVCCDGWVEEVHFDGRQTKNEATRRAIVGAAAKMTPTTIDQRTVDIPL